MRNRNRKCEIRANVDESYLNALKQRLDLSNTTDVLRIAFSLLDWVSEEAEAGRMILSASREGKDIRRLVVPELSNTKSRTRDIGHIS